MGSHVNIHCKLFGVGLYGVGHNAKHSSQYTFLFSSSKFVCVCQKYSGSSHSVMFFLAMNVASKRNLLYFSFVWYRTFSRMLHA